MTRVTVEIEGLAAAQARLAEIAGGLQALERPMQEATALVQGEMMVYPPQLAGSSYRRTRVLGNAWTTEVRSLASEVEGVVGNNTVYAPLVQDREQQLPVHQGRWQTGQAVLEKLREQIVGFFERELRRLLGE